MNETPILSRAYSPLSFECKGLTNKPDGKGQRDPRRSEGRVFQVVATTDAIFYSGGVYLDAETGQPLHAFSGGEAHFTDTALTEFRRIQTPEAGNRRLSESLESAPHEYTPRDGSVSVLCGYPGSDFNYGHYLTDVLGELLYFKRHQAEFLQSVPGPEAVMTILVPKPKHPSLAQPIHALHDYFAVREEDIGWLSDTTFIVGKKIFCRDARIHPFCHAPWLLDGLQAEITDRVQRHGRSRHGSLRCVFIRRGEPGHRARDLSEEAETRTVELIGTVLGHCEAIDPTETAIAELFAAVNSADLVVGVMGANMSNVVAARRGTHALFLTPVTMNAAYHLDVCSCLGVTYHEYRIEGFVTRAGQGNTLSHNVVDLDDRDFSALREMLVNIKAMAEKPCITAAPLTTTFTV